jgi:hypothetical protein
MWRCLLLSVAIFANAAPAFSTGRYYCAADDAAIRLSLDVGFETAGARKLNHFRGALVAKATSVPAGFRTLMLDSSQLVHHWVYDGDLRLEVFARGEEQDAGRSFDLVVISSGKDDSTPMPGSYALTFSAADAAPVELRGRLTCSAK